MANIVLLQDWITSQIEFWAVVPDCPRYDISSFGRLRSRTRKVHHMMKCFDNGKGYLYGNIGGTRALHRLVAEAFKPNLHGLPEVNHLNAIKHDCRVDNLEWSTSRGNTAHAELHGLSRHVTGIKHGRAIMDDGKVRLLRILRARGMGFRRVAQVFNIAVSTAKQIDSGRTWKHVA